MTLNNTGIYFTKSVEKDLIENKLERIHENETCPVQNL